ncbi:MAG TPA: type IV conjugative transfer system lipoprotein TraV [Burkholderiaceae bacterium]|nr:type IV conjugative transfer system lipoprotein TraV [Burkholderiaceae bacterium]
MTNRIAIVVLTAALSACSSITGFDGPSSFSCKLPEGIRCEPMSSVYAQSVKSGGQPPASRSRARGNRAATDDGAVPVRVVYSEAPMAGASMATQMDEGRPLRQAERIVRLWLAPHEDAEGDLHDARFIYVSLGRGEWTIARSRATGPASTGTTRLGREEQMVVPASSIARRDEIGG